VQVLTFILAIATAGAFALALFALTRSEQQAVQELEPAGQPEVFKFEIMPPGFTLAMALLTLLFVFVALGLTMDSPTIHSDATAVFVMLSLISAAYSVVRLFNVERIAISAEGTIEFQALAKSLRYSLFQLTSIARVPGSRSDNCDILKLNFDGESIVIKVGHDGDADSLVRRLLDLRHNVEVRGLSYR
jgi:hypothetical protein